MKLATKKNGTRDGELITVSKDLTQAVSLIDFVPTLQAALDDWDKHSSQIAEIYKTLNKNQMPGAFDLHIHELMSPLPRAYQWADGSAYVNHVELVRKARGATMPENFWHDPLMYQGGSDSFLGPMDDIKLASTKWGIDFEAEIAIITKDVPMGVNVEDAGKYINLVMLVNDVSLRNLIPNEISKGFGFFNSKPSSSFSPVALTLDELKPFWKENKLHLPLRSTLNNKLFGEPNAGIDMTFDFATLIAHAAKTRPLSAGTIIGSGTVSNLDRSKGSSCIAEKRMLETIEYGKPSTDFMQFGDTIHIEMLDDDGKSLFGAISQAIVQF
jgi:fumarylacetoacetate (FAA) hydrolase